MRVCVCVCVLKKKQSPDLIGAVICVWKLVHDRSPGQHTLFAQFNLGIRYVMGKGVRHDDTEAVKWFRLASEGAHAHAGAQYTVTE